jgi:PHP family Zn ribbon phosphoesterase
MTPRNIAFLADMLGLNAVALTDHNSCKNAAAFFKAAEKTDIIPIAGMELNTQEEIHTLCLFPELRAALAFDDEVVYPSLMRFKNREDKNGKQLVMDENDDITGREPLWLAPATPIPLYSLAEKVKAYGGIMVPAHINRLSWGVISVLGDVPGDCGFDCVEVRGKEAVENLKARYPYLNECRIIHNSDAHKLDGISLPVNFIETEEKSAKGVIAALSKAAGGGRRAADGGRL